MDLHYITSLIHVFLTSVITIHANSKWTIFEAKESFGGKTCNEADFLFMKILPRSKLDCLIECVNHVDCVSVFQSQQTGACTGCRVRYDLVTSPIQVMDGSRYYEEQSKHIYNR